MHFSTLANNPNSRLQKPLLKMRLDYTMEFIWIMPGYDACEPQTIEKIINTLAMRSLLPKHLRWVNDLGEAFLSPTPPQCWLSEFCPFSPFFYGNYGKIVLPFILFSKPPMLRICFWMTSVTTFEWFFDRFSRTTVQNENFPTKGPTAVLTKFQRFC